MTPGIRPGQLPPFHELDEYIFQDMCRDLFDAEPEIATCEVYGKRGQSQDGIDLLAHRVVENGVEVGQCKCYTNFTARQIVAASDEFFDYWDARWSGAKVKRFILFVACDLKDRKCQDEILTQKERFAQVGITYQAWSAAQIQNKLRPYRTIASTYLPPHWADIICGATQSILSTDQTSNIVVKALESTLTQAAEFLSETTIQGLAQMREAWREGHRKEAMKWLQENRSNPTKWNILSPLAKAKLLCFEASLELSTDADVDRAKVLVDEAHSNVPTDTESRIRATIAFHEGDFATAVGMLTDRNSVDDINLRALLLLVQGDAAKCLACLDFAGTSLIENTETHRVRALAYLIVKDLDHSFIEIEKAHEISPMWEDVRIAKAVIQYYSALAPAAIPEWPLSGPDPVDWELVKRDDNTITRLREAAETFKAIAKLHEKASRTRREYQAWYFACLANDPVRQEDATSYCRKKLAKDPTNYRLIAWAYDRNLEIELEPSRAVLEERVHDNAATAQDVIALMPCYLRIDRADAAIELLTNSAPLFNNHRARTVQTSWLLQITAQIGDPSAALEKLKDAAQDIEELRSTKTVILRALAHKSNDWQQLQAHLEQCYTETNDPKYLLESCQLKAHQSDWAYIADHATILVDRIGTGATATLSAIGLFNAHRFDQCLELLKKSPDFFPGRRLPGQLRRVRILCQRKLGIASEAIAEGEQLVQDDPTIENMLALARLYVNTADLPNVEVITRRLLQQEDLTVGEALEISSIVGLQNLSLAQDLWKRAMSMDVPDDLVTVAMGLGFKLGLDAEVKPLISRMQTIAIQGNDLVKQISIDELLTSVIENRDRLAELSALYSSGTMPIHTIARALNLPLVALYHQQLSQSGAEAPLYNQQLLLIRHGARPINYKIPQEKLNWRINLDITALLLAEHLGILKIIERTLSPLRIPSSLPSSLVQMWDQLASNQPSVDRAIRTVVKLVEARKITAYEYVLPEDFDDTILIEQLGEEWTAAFSFVQQNNGILLDFLPLLQQGLSGLPAVLPENAMAHIGNCRTAVELLRGKISEVERANALEHLGTEGREFNDLRSSSEISLIHCDAGIAKLLADAGILNHLCKYYHVQIASSELQMLQRQLEDSEQRETMQTWLAELTGRVSRGISRGIYQLIPTNLEAFADGDNAGSAAEKSLLELFSFKSGGSDIIWIDDRFASAYPHRDGVPVVGIIEIAGVLLGRGVINQGEYYNILSQLRLANAHFIPTTSDEILYFLSRATVTNDRLDETVELQKIRQHAATSLIRGAILQKPNTPDIQDDAGETNYILSLTREIGNAITSVWETTPDIDIARAKTEWIYTNLFLETVAMSKITGLPHAEEGMRYLISVSFAGLLSYGIGLPFVSTDGHVTPRRAYMGWLSDRVLGPRFTADRYLSVSIAEILKTMVFGLSDEPDADIEPESRTFILRRFYDDLPDSIKAELDRDESFLDRVGYVHLSFVSMGDLRFDREEFFKRISYLVNGAAVEIKLADSDTLVSLRPATSPQGYRGLTFVHPTTNETVRSTLDELELLSDSITDREAVLLRHRPWFDTDDGTFKDAVAELVTISDQLRRVDTAIEWRDSSPAMFYQHLASSLVVSNSFRFDDLLLPQPVRLFDHLRLPHIDESGATFIGVADIAAAKLIDQEGLQTAIDRYAGIPIALPAPIIESIKALNPSAKRDLVKQLLRWASSPLSRIHFLRILAICSDIPACSRLADRLRRSCLQEEAEAQFDCFHEILEFTITRLASNETWNNALSSVKMATAWYHTHRLYVSFAAAEASMIELADLFKRQRRIPRGVFERRNEQWHDIAYPRNIAWLPFAVAGLAYAAPEISDSEFTNYLVTRCFMGDGMNRMPDLHLALDTTLARNVLGSFLGGERSDHMRALLKPEDAQDFSSSTLQNLFEQAMQGIAEGEPSFWKVLVSVLGNLPCYEELSSQLTDLITKTDFVTTLRDNYVSGVSALHVATRHCLNTHNLELCEHLENQLVSVAVAYADNRIRPQQNHNETGREISAMVLIDSALTLATARVTLADVHMAFATSVGQLVDSWPAIASECRPTIQRICDELPASEAQHYWKLLVRLRAE